MTHENTIKAILTAALTALGAYMTNLLVPLFILIIMVVLDYATGMTNAWIHKELSSQRGIQGIFKKLGYFVVVVIAISIDYLIINFANTINIKMSPETTVISMLVTIWLILTESLSILENLDKIGTPMPTFLKKLIEHLKQKTEETGDSDAESGGESK